MEDIKNSISALKNGELGSTVVGVPAEPDFTKSPPVATAGMFPGMIGDIVRDVTTHTEAVPAAVAANIITRFGAMVGRPSKQTPGAPFLYLGDGVIHIRPFFLITGATSKGRKGTSDKPAQRIFDRVDEILFERHSLEWRAENKTEPEKYWPLNTYSGGLSTGEGMAYHLRDEREDKDGEVIPGQPDKRLFVVEEEFANVLAVCRREHNTLSGTIRKLWDGETLSPMTKSDRNIATNPHVCIVGHITGYELVEKSTSNDIANGLLNRFITLYSRREQLRSRPHRTDDSVINDLATKIADAIQFAQSSGAMDISDDGWLYWDDTYKQLTTWEGGRTIDSMFARSEPYALMLAAIFALLDLRKIISVDDLKTAMEWVDYWRHSLVYVFDGERQKVEAEKEICFSEEVCEAVYGINKGSGCTRTELSNHFNRNKTSEELSGALQYLIETIPPKIRMDRKIPKGGSRKTKMYFPMRN